MTYLFVSASLNHREPHLSLIERIIHPLEPLDSELKGGTVCDFISHQEGMFSMFFP